MIEEYIYFKKESEALQYYKSFLEEQLMVYKALQKKGIISKSYSVFAPFRRIFPYKKIKQKRGRKDLDLKAKANLFEQTFFEHILQLKESFDETDEVFIRGMSCRGNSIEFYKMHLPEVQERRADRKMEDKEKRKKWRNAGLTKLELKIWGMRQGFNVPSFREIAARLNKSESTCKTLYYRADSKVNKIPSVR